MENLIVALIVGGAVWYVARTFFGKKPASSACGCGCRGCDVRATCDGGGISPTPPKGVKGE